MCQSIHTNSYQLNDQLIELFVYQAMWITFFKCLFVVDLKKAVCLLKFKLGTNEHEVSFDIMVNIQQDKLDYFFPKNENKCFYLIDLNLAF